MGGVATVERDVPLGLPAPQTMIAIAVDTAYVASQGGFSIRTGVYMCDNRLSAGSTGEGGLALTTRCDALDLVGFQVFPVNGLGTSGDTVAITGFNVSQGSVFGSQGYPIQMQPNYWIGQAMTAGSQAYQIRIQVITGGLRPTKFNATCPAAITAV